MCCAYVELFEDGVFFYSREHDSHGVGTILQEGNLHSVHVIGQFLDVCLQLCKGCRKKKEDVTIAFFYPLKISLFSVTYHHEVNVYGTFL